RERVFDAVLVDDGWDLGLDEGAHLLEDRELFGAQGLDELIEVAVGGRERLGLGYGARGRGGRCGSLHGSWLASVKWKVVRAASHGRNQTTAARVFRPTRQRVRLGSGNRPRREVRGGRSR